MGCGAGRDEPGRGFLGGCRWGFLSSGLCGREFHVGLPGKAGIAWPGLRGRCLTWQLWVPSDATGSAAASGGAPTLRRQPGLQVLRVADTYPRAWEPQLWGLSWSQKRGWVGDGGGGGLPSGHRCLVAWGPWRSRAPASEASSREASLCGEGGREHGRAIIQAQRHTQADGNTDRRPGLSPALGLAKHLHQVWISKFSPWNPSVPLGTWDP